MYFTHHFHQHVSAVLHLNASFVGLDQENLHHLEVIHGEGCLEYPSHLEILASPGPVALAVLSNLHLKQRRI